MADDETGSALSEEGEIASDVGESPRDSNGGQEPESDDAAAKAEAALLANDDESEREQEREDDKIRFLELPR